jgi:hypothetical protein
MSDWLPALLVAVPVASGMAASQLIQSEYPNTWFLFTPRKSKAFYGYCLLWGSVAFVLTLIFDALLANEIITIKGLKLESPWTRALIVGLTAKALVQISLYNLTSGSRTIPIGPALVVQPLEPWLLKKIKQDEASELRMFVKPWAAKYTNLDDVRERSKGAPSDLDGPELLAFGEEMDDAKTVEVAMEKHVKALGKKSFNTVFSNDR